MYVSISRLIPYIKGGLIARNLKVEVMARLDSLCRSGTLTRCVVM